MLLNPKQEISLVWKQDILSLRSWLYDEASLPPHAPSSGVHFCLWPFQPRATACFFSGCCRLHYALSYVQDTEPWRNFIIRNHLRSESRLGNGLSLTEITFFPLSQIRRFLFTFPHTDRAQTLCARIQGLYPSVLKDLRAKSRGGWRTGTATAHYRAISEWDVERTGAYSPQNVNKLFGLVLK